MKNNIITIKKKTIFVTGAYGYIGSRVTLDLAKEGANLILNGRDLSKLKKIQNKILKYNKNVKLANFDINDYEKMKFFFEKNCTSVINSIIHNANYSNSGGIKQVNEDDYITSFKTAVVSAQNLFKCSLPNLSKSVKQSNFSSFITIGSIYGYLSPIFDNYGSEKYYNPPNYGASKSALIQWTKYAACQYGKYGIRFNSISPGPIPNINKKINKKFLQKLIKKIPIQEFGKPKDLSGIILFLCSNSSQFINGSNIVVDGGWSAW